MDISELLLRLILAFVVLFTMARLMGRKEISQMTFFNFVSAIAIGSITASLVTNQNFTIRNGIIALVGWTAFTLVMDIIDIKSKSARKITTGEPIIVIKEGKVMEDALRKVRLDMDSLTSLLRRNHIFSINDVEHAIFETSGNLSVQLKESKLPVTKGDLNIINPNVIKYPMATEVISDGIVNTNNLSRLDLDENWLNKQLQQAGITEVEQVFYAEVQKDGSLYIDSKNDIVH
ncbi:DUF421 domain-containing protein [Ornithinibacillus halophilus]|uniref:Uncharacterized membrane protein YcaP, DUF421 family n=1 Tax=Ornithinibacillus halophilus TaxID=930117 RepID=A0A1M5FLD1_9BACI|nr:DUF421 domain-containing protein [Ornithinibacillus halophilus]SHF92295.1 Uncharacterized membrane protein YcaP, DUF421 family [Ornithinibacillus halophilus]